jgi:hypothetical protein
MVAVIGGNTRITRWKDMEHLSGLRKTDTSGSSCRISVMVMEYTDGKMEQSIMDSGNRISRMVTDIGRVLMELMIIPSGRMAYEREMQS